MAFLHIKYRLHPQNIFVAVLNQPPRCIHLDAFSKDPHMTLWLTADTTSCFEGVSCASYSAFSVI